ncbi:uncharacterized protein LOC143584200 [Bidens hawaiensis]|uniref:uncharacterized protein LOC143584200 n=1 Tax=Bidens hawaiensis TaxID=980011 RepID=UPI00404A49AB
MTSHSVNYNLEDRSTKDDAWYKCGVVLEHENRLRVKFKNLVQPSNDEVFSVSDFSSNDEIDIFRRRFRPESEPVGEDECRKVAEGVMVSAVGLDDKQLRYFDAIVDAVCHKEHTPKKCLCTYFLYWQHGPEEGIITEANLDDIHLIKHGPVDPTVVNFTKLIKEKIKVKSASFEFTLIPKNTNISKDTSSNETITRPQEIGSAGNGSHVGLSAGKELEGEKETKPYHYIILENLEKDLCPLLMTDFIREQTLITAQAYVFPSLLLETYTRGVIMVDDETKLKKIYEFINNPNQLIVSSSGRPWVLAEDELRNGAFNTNLQRFQPKYKSCSTKNDLMVVRLGTEEYAKAKELKDLYLMFRNHLNGLLKRLVMEEEKITRAH